MNTQEIQFLKSKIEDLYTKIELLTDNDKMQVILKSCPIGLLNIFVEKFINNKCSSSDVINGRQMNSV